MAALLDHIPDRTIVVNGTQRLYFGGTAYLGLQSYSPFIELYLENVRKLGMHYGASRKSNVKLSIYDKTEEWLGHWVGSESCITLSSGYLAAQLVVQTLAQRGHRVIVAPNAHIALSTQNVVKTANPKDFYNSVAEALNMDSTIAPAILFDTIDFSGGQFPNFEILRELPLDKIILVGDDSHGIGVVGPNGSGCYGMLKQLKPAQLITCASLGKGLGIQSGAIFGSKKTLDMLRNTAFFGGASPASPAFLGTLLNAGDIYKKRRAILMSHLEYLEGISHFKPLFTHIKGHPTFEFRNPELAKWLEQNNFVFTNFSYPDDHGPIVSRIVLSAYHKIGDIQKLAGCLNNFVT